MQFCKRQFSRPIFQPLLLAATLGFALAACDSVPGINQPSDSSKETAQLSCQASTAPHSTGAAKTQGAYEFVIDPLTQGVALAGGDSAGHAVDLTDFRIAIEEVKFKNEDESETEMATDEVEFQGPFTLDLLDSASATAQTLGDVKIPTGTYDGIEFKMHKADELASTDVLFERSIYIKGTVELTPGSPQAFLMWHETGEEFFLTGPNGITVADGQSGNDLIVDFKLLSVLDGIDFGNGCVDLTDINPQSTDSNCKDIAETLKDNLKAAADFGKDEDGDGEIGEDEDID